MLRFRFTPGLILGLVLGIPTGAVIAVMLLPTTAVDHGGATSLQLQDLTRRLEAAKDDRERANKQLEQFGKLAEQMTSSFNNLEQRFKALQEEQRLQEARPRQAPPPPPAPTATALQPTPPQEPTSPPQPNAADDTAP